MAANIAPSAVSSGGESKMLRDIAKALDLSTNGDPALRLGKDALMRGVFCSDYGPERDYAKLAATGDTLAEAAPRFVWKFWNSSPIANATHTGFSSPSSPAFHLSP